MTINCPFCTNTKKIGERVLAFDVHTGVLATDLGDCKFTHNEAIIFNSLRNGRPVHQDKMMEDLYGDDGYDRNVKIIHAFISRMNKLLLNVGLVVLSYGYGTFSYYLSDKILKRRGYGGRKEELSAQKKEILEIIKQNHNMTPSAIRAAAPHLEKNTISNALYFLEKKGKIERVAIGLYRVKS